MSFLNKKQKTPQEYNPISKKGQEGIFYAMVFLIVFVLVYVLSFYF